MAGKWRVRVGVTGEGGGGQNGPDKINSVRIVTVSATLDLSRKYEFLTKSCVQNDEPCSTLMRDRGEGSVANDVKLSVPRLRPAVGTIAIFITRDRSE